MNRPVEMELIEQLRAQLLCHRIDERSLRLGAEALLRELQSGARALPEAPRLLPAPSRRSRMEQVQLRMAEIQRRIQRRIEEMQERIQSAYMVGPSSAVCACPLRWGRR